MSIRILGKIPKECTVAFSGGVDSVAVADFLLNGKKSVSLAFFHHGTTASEKAEEFAKSFASDRSIPLIIGRISRERDKKESLEEFWRIERYKFLESVDQTVVTAHHLDDAVETWIFTSLHGTPKLLPVKRNNVIRPFLATEKEGFIQWCKKREVKWVEDESNKDLKFSRNRIRHNIVPEALKVNPGLRTVIRKKYLSLSENIV